MATKLEFTYLPPPSTRIYNATASPNVHHYMGCIHTGSNYVGLQVDDRMCTKPDQQLH